jgi:hypothetical protein
VSELTTVDCGSTVTSDAPPDLPGRRKNGRIENSYRHDTVHRRKESLDQSPEGILKKTRKITLY